MLKRNYIKRSGMVKGSIKLLGLLRREREWEGRAGGNDGYVLLVMMMLMMILLGHEDGAATTRAAEIGNVRFGKA